MKALVIGHTPYEWHELLVRQKFLEVAPSNWVCEIVMVGSGTPSYPIVAYVQNIAQAVQYAVNNNYKIIIRSYSNPVGYLTEWEYAYENNIIVVHAHGSNSAVELLSPSFLLRSVICVSGGITNNQRSYGNGLELFDATPSGETEQSWATPVVAGRIAHLMNEYPSANICTIRGILRQKCTNYQSGWNKYNGYGRPINPNPSVIDVQPPFEITYSKNDKNIYTFRWKNCTQDGFQATRVVLNNSVIYEGTGESFSFSSYVLIPNAQVKFYTKANNNYSRDELYSVFNMDIEPTIGNVGNITASINSDGNIVLEATPIQGATSYEFRCFQTNQVFTSSSNTIVISPNSLIPQDIYTFLYRGYNGYIYTSWSNQSNGVSVSRTPRPSLLVLNISERKLIVSEGNDYYDVYKDGVYLGRFNSNVINLNLSDYQGNYQIYAKRGNLGVSNPLNFGYIKNEKPILTREGF